MSSESEIGILRELAYEVAEIASLPIQKERIKLIKDLNSLKEERQVVLAAVEGGWKEFVPYTSLYCKDPLLRSWEQELRKAIARYSYIPAHGEPHRLTRWLELA